MNCSFMDIPSLILGGDLNLTLGEVEVCGPRVVQNPLSNFFTGALDHK